MESTDIYGYGYNDQPLTNADNPTISRNDFNISQFQYPSDLGSEDLKHWVQFSILVRGKSKISLGAERRLTQVRRDPDSAQRTESELAVAKNVAVAGGGLAAGYASGKIISEARNMWKDRNTKTGSDISGSALKKLTIAGGIAAGAVGLLSELLEADVRERISDVIALYIDGPPTVRYNAGYSNKDLGTIAGMVSGGTSTITNAVESAAAMTALFAKLPQIAGASTADVLGASAKVALNPFKEVLFESIDFRTFAFKYRFFPKSRAESIAVEEIIKRFKFHMHPELSANKLFFIYPSEFEIAYYYQNKENHVFHKFKPCVLESMEVSYGGEQFSTFDNGYPTEINMSLTFRETEILTKEQIKQGY